MIGQTTRRTATVRRMPAWMDTAVDIRTAERQAWHSRMLCGVGLHTGTWVYIDEASRTREGSCTQMRACRRCGKADTRVRHTRRWVYTRKAGCEQTRVCARCGERTGRRTKHTRQWQYARAAECEQTKSCSRCGDVSARRTRHVWSATYSVGSAHNGHNCQRCYKRETWSTANDD